MSREEAIKVLNGKARTKIVNVLETREWFKFREALEMAIQALEQNESAEEWYKLFVEKLDEQQPCDDAVSREWLMRKATERFYTTNYFNHISAMIEEAPSVTQKSGKWKYVPDADGFYICSECGCGNGYADNFCPQCGAKMVEPQESEEI